MQGGAHVRFAILTALVSLLGFGALAQADTAEKWVCKKDGKELKVTGKDAQAQEKACKAKGATWEKVEAEASAPKDEPKQEAGGGGGW
jgi:hypothetical protein